MARYRLSQAIVLDYLKQIGSGELKPGSPMPTEAVLCEKYEVGRSVVREALQALHAKGFIVVRQGSVATVADRQHWNVLDTDFLAVHSGQEFFLDLQVARETLEPQIAYLAAQNRSEEDVAALEAAHAAATKASNPKDHARNDIEFHRALAQASGNAILASFHDSLTSLGQRTRSASATVPGAIGRAWQWHEQILAAVRSRDPESASAAMRLHLRQVREEIQRLEQEGSGPQDEAL